MKTIVALFTFTSEFLNGKTYLLGNKSILLFKNLALYILNEKSQSHHAGSKRDLNIQYENCEAKIVTVLLKLIILKHFNKLPGKHFLKRIVSQVFFSGNFDHQVCGTIAHKSVEQLLKAR